MRLTRMPRVVQLCLHGTTAKPHDNADRIKMLPEIVLVLNELPDWHPIDAVVLPGGFFRMARAFGAAGFAERRAAVRRERFAGAVQTAVSRLEELSPGLRLVTGVLATSRDSTERTEQASLAFSAKGLVAVARKIFPTAKDTRGRRFISPFVDDYSSPKRLLQLSNGSTALLSACYDLFGAADIGIVSGSRRQAIRRLITRKGYLTQGEAGFADTRLACLAAWTKLIEEHQPDVALATIHGFRAPGLDGFWQRHGIARASAALDGALVVGAAHFGHRLPDPHASSLAAHGVAHEHIFAGTFRLSHRLMPIASTVIEVPGCNALLRLFTPPSGRTIKAAEIGR